MADEMPERTVEEEEEEEEKNPCGDNYWCVRNILVNFGAVLIFFINLTLIIVLRISPQCRRHVSFSICCYSATKYLTHQSRLSWLLFTTQLLSPSLFLHETLILLSF